MLDKPTLSISSKKIKDCSTVINILKKQGIISQVNHNVSIIDETNNNKNIIIENGCNIKFITFPKNQSLQSIWEVLRKKYNLTCAHLEVPGKYTGCIYNYLNPPKCPIN